MVATPPGSADLSCELMRLRNVGKDLPNVPILGNDPIMLLPRCGGGGDA